MFRRAACRLYFLVALGLLTVAGCGVPGEGEVRSDFRKEHPSYEVVSAGPGEGDGGAVYYVIKYRKPGDDSVYEVEWQYMDRGGERWELTNRGREKKLGPRAAG